MAKQTTSFRVTEDTKGKIEELSELFSQNSGEVIERAISYLYLNRESVARQEFEERLKKIIE